MGDTANGMATDEMLEKSESGLEALIAFEVLEANNHALPWAQSPWTQHNWSLMSLDYFSDTLSLHFRRTLSH